MRIFVTGASGWIGSAVVAELLAADHEVLGLARSDASAEAVDAAGGEVRRGDIGDLNVLRGAGWDRPAPGSRLGPRRPEARHAATERDIAEPFPGAGGRALNERAALAFAERGVRSMSVRFAPTVHGTGDNGFIASVVAADRAAGSAAYIGEGAHRWPAVHRSDAARLVRLGVEGAPAGSVLHAVGEQGVAIRDVAEAIGRGLNLPVTSITNEQAAAHFGFLAGFLAMDIPASSALTRELLSWEPSGPGLVADLEQGHYFAGAAA